MSQGRDSQGHLPMIFPCRHSFSKVTYCVNAKDSCLGIMVARLCNRSTATLGKTQNKDVHLPQQSLYQITSYPKKRAEEPWFYFSLVCIAFLESFSLPRLSFPLNLVAILVYCPLFHEYLYLLNITILCYFRFANPCLPIVLGREKCFV